MAGGGRIVWLLADLIIMVSHAYLTTSSGDSARFVSIAKTSQCWFNVGPASQMLAQH